MTDPDFDQIEIQVIQDVIDTVEIHLRRAEAGNQQLNVPRSRVHAAVIHAVITSARAQSHYATLDCAEVLDSILDGVESATASQVFDRIIADATRSPG